MTTEPSDQPEGDVVDLAAFVDPVGRLLDFYDRLADLGQQEPPIEELDDILRTFRDLPDPGGRLGDDLELIRKGGAGASRAEVIDAIGRLRRIAAMPTDGGRSSVAAS